MSNNAYGHHLRQDDSTTSAVHGEDQTVDSCRRDVGPHLGDGLAKWRGCGWPRLQLVQSPLTFDPQVFYRVQVGTEGRPRHRVDVVGLQELLGGSGGVSCRVVLREQEVLVVGPERHDVGSQDLVDATLRVDQVSTALTKVCEEDWPNALMQPNSTPYHDVWASPRVSLQHTSISKPFSYSTPDPDATTRHVNTKSAFVREEDPSPLIQHLLFDERR